MEEFVYNSTQVKAFHRCLSRQQAGACSFRHLWVRLTLSFGRARVRLLVVILWGYVWKAIMTELSFTACPKVVSTNLLFCVFLFLLIVCRFCVARRRSRARRRQRWREHLFVEGRVSRGAEPAAALCDARVAGHRGGSHRQLEPVLHHAGAECPARKKQGSEVMVRLVC